MAYTNSPLVDYTCISPNRTVGRNHSIDTITIHCVVGQCSVETLGNIFANPDRGASSNYGVGVDGRIGMYCEEKDRSWCSSSASNDHRAITIETASDTDYPYAVKDVVYDSLIKLVADICKRNNIKKLLWVDDPDLIGDVSKQNMTLHRWFAATACPGEYLYSRMGDIASKVNAIIDGGTPTPTPTPTTDFRPGDIVEITGDTYYDGQTIPGWVKEKDWIVDSVSGDRVVVDKSVDGQNSIMSPVAASDLKLIKRPSNSNSSSSSSASKKSSEQIAYEVVRGECSDPRWDTWGNGDTRKERLKAAGYDYSTVQNIVNKMMGGSSGKVAQKPVSSSTSPKKSSEQIASEIINGTCSDSRWSSWGNGDTRKERLKAAGYDYSTVQGIVNRMMSGSYSSSSPSTSSSANKTSEQIAREIIAGTCSDPRWSSWGNGDTRKARLEAAGYSYSSVQSIINRLLG